MAGRMDTSVCWTRLSPGRAASRHGTCRLRCTKRRACGVTVACPGVGASENGAGLRAPRGDVAWVPSTAGTAFGSVHIDGVCWVELRTSRRVPSSMYPSVGLQTVVQKHSPHTIGNTTKARRPGLQSTSLLGRLTGTLLNATPTVSGVPHTVHTRPSHTLHTCNFAIDSIQEAIDAHPLIISLRALLWRSYAADAIQGAFPIPVRASRTLMIISSSTRRECDELSKPNHASNRAGTLEVVALTWWASGCPHRSPESAAGTRSG